MTVFQSQLKEYITSVDNTPKVGVDPQLTKKIKSLNKEIDGLITTLDDEMEETEKFKEKYTARMDDKTKFYEEQKYWKEQNEKENKDEDNSLEGTSSMDLSKLKLDDDIISDLKYGAENIRTGLKEKYLGRDAGAKRGETSLQYVPATLTLAIGAFMFSVLAYVWRQVNVHAKNKIW